MHLAQPAILFPVCSSLVILFYQGTAKITNLFSITSLHIKGNPFIFINIGPLLSMRSWVLPSFRDFLERPSSQRAIYPATGALLPPSSQSPQEAAHGIQVLLPPRIQLACYQLYAGISELSAYSSNNSSMLADSFVMRQSLLTAASFAYSMRLKVCQAIAPLSTFSDYSL